jgi:hypothetical protein
VAKTIEPHAREPLATSRPDASNAAPKPSEQGAASEDVLAELSEIGARLAKQALVTGQLVLDNGKTVDLGPGDILRCSQWAAQIGKPKRKSTLPLPREAFLPQTE